MKAQADDYDDFMKLFGLDVENIQARFGCQCVECKRLEVALRARERKKEDGG